MPMGSVVEGNLGHITCHAIMFHKTLNVTAVVDAGSRSIDILAGTLPLLAFFLQGETYRSCPINI